MPRQYLIPVKDTEDAKKAIAGVPQIAEQGDELVVLFISEIPEGEPIGSRPPAQVMDPLMTTGGVSSEPRAADDRPVMLGREEIMEIKGRELRESVQPDIARLNDQGYKVRVDAVFSDQPGPAIRDVAEDLNVTDVFLTEDFRKRLDEETRELVRTLDRPAA